MKFNCSYKELLDIDDPRIVPNPRNPNIHPDAQIERLAKIIDYQGQRSPIVISNQSGFISKGHGRLMAIKKLGWQKVAVDFQDYENAAQEYADIVADNAIAEWATLDKSLILDEIKELEIDDINLFGIEDFNLVGIVDEEKEEKKENEQKTWKIEAEFPNEMEMRDVLDDLTHRGYIVRDKSA